MKFVYFIAGTGSYYCGVCLRDHALVDGLKHFGHDVDIVPVYLPLVTDKPVDDHTPLFMGGINMYLQQKSAIFRNTPCWLDRVFDNRFLLVLASRLSSMTNPEVLGEMTLSTMTLDDGYHRKELGKLLTWLEQQPSIDAVFLSHSLLAGLAGPIKKTINVPIVCSLQGEDTFLDSLPKPYSTRCRDVIAEQMLDMDVVIVASEFYRNLMQERLAIPAEMMHIVPNGIRVSDFDLQRKKDHPPVLGFLSQIIPSKGVEMLVNAFIELKKNDELRSLQLHIAGSVVPSYAGFPNKIKVAIRESGYDSDVRLKTNITMEEKLEFLSGLSVLSVPTTYGESFGLYIIEALAAGVPVVQPRHGAFPELIEATKGGLLYEPGEMESYTSALESLLLDEDRAAQIGEAGRKAVFERYNNHNMANRVCQILENERSSHSDLTSDKSKRKNG